jgi:hypothetical protein
MNFLFIHPMWDHESQRIGKQKCTPTGYALHGIGEMIGILGLLFLFVAPTILVCKWSSGTFEAALFWLLAVPFGLGVVSEILVQLSWRLALRKGFKYDYERCEASWIEAGERRTYKYPGLTNS